MKSKLYFGIGGLIVGLAVGIAIVGNMVSKKYAEKIEALEMQNEDLRDQLHKARKSLKNGDISEIKTKVEKTEVEEPEDDDPFDVEDPEITNPIGRGEYERLVNRYSLADDEDDISPHPTDGDEDVDEFGIRPMTSEAYHQDLDYRDSEMLTYYQQDGVLCDAVNDILFREETYVGSQIMDMIDETDEDVLYCENLNEDKIYEITIEHSVSYFRDVMGQMPDDD